VSVIALPERYPMSRVPLAVVALTLPAWACASDTRTQVELPEVDTSR
jgi:hypothetical protein